MPYTPPTEAVLLEQQETYLEEALIDYSERRGLGVSPAAIARSVRSPHTLIGIQARRNAMLLANVHRHIAWATQQWFVDTASEAFLSGSHAETWGVVPRPATRAIGKAVATGTPGLAIPAGVECRVPGGGLLATSAPAIIGGGGTVTVDLLAVEAGADANAPGGTVLPLISPLPGLATQQFVADAAGLAGGAAAETVEEHRARILERIRNPPHGGAAFDYPVWVKNKFAASHVVVLQNSTLGTVRVVIAMGTKAAPLVPTAAELEAIEIHVGRWQFSEGLRPVTAQVLLFPVVLLPVAHQIEVEPDTAAVRAAVTAAISAFYAADATIGGTIHLSRLSEAISSARGEYRHRIWSPAASIVAGEFQLPVPGAIAWGAPP